MLNFFKKKRGINKSKEVTSGGSQIIRHTKDFGRKIKTSENFSENQNIREKFFEKYLGEIDTVFHEIIPLDPHIDVYSFAPTEKRNSRLLISSGMSDKDMNIPPELSEKWKRVEIIFPVKENTFQLNPDLVANAVRVYASFVHRFDTFLSHGHTVPSYFPNESMFKEFDDRFKNALFLRAIPFGEIPKEFFDSLVVDNLPVTLLHLIPITQSELKYKLEKGSGVLIDMFEEKGFPFVFNHLREDFV